MRKKAAAEFFAFLLAVMTLIHIPAYFNEENKITVSDINFRIAVLGSETSDKNFQIYQGFTEACADSGINIDITYRNAGGSQETAEKYAETFAADDFDAVIAIDAIAAVALNNMIKEIPIVFAAVRDPEAEGLVESNSQPGGNITGISDYTPCFEQIELLHNMYPDVKRVGTIYNENDADAITQVIIAKYQIEDLELTYNEYPMTNFDELDSVLEKMAEENEIIYLPEDKTILNRSERINAFFSSKNIPVIGATEAMIESGALATVLIDFNHLGADAARIVLDILINERDPAYIPVEYTSYCVPRFNILTAIRLAYIPTAAEFNNVLYEK